MPVMSLLVVSLRTRERQSVSVPRERGADKKKTARRGVLGGLGARTSIVSEVFSERVGEERPAEFEGYCP